MYLYPHRANCVQLRYSLQSAANTHWHETLYRISLDCAPHCDGIRNPVRLCNTILWLANCIQEFVNCMLASPTPSLLYCIRVWKIRAARDVIRVTSFLLLHRGHRRYGFLPRPESGIIPRAARLKDIPDGLRPGSMSTSVSTPRAPGVHACLSRRERFP